MSKTALVTVNFGGMLCSNARLSMLDACRRWGCEYREINESNSDINELARYEDNITPRLRKSHITSYFKQMVFVKYPEFDHIFYVDADVIIRSDCPSPFETFGDDAFVAVPNIINEHDHNSLEIEEGIRNLYKLSESHTYFNSGMFLMPKKYSAVFKRSLAYASIYEWDHWIEQSPFNLAVSHEVQAGRMNYVTADAAWNYRGPRVTMTEKPMMDYIYHYAGVLGRKEVMERFYWYAVGISTRDRMCDLLCTFDIHDIGVEVGVAAGNFSKLMLQSWSSDSWYMVDRWEYLPGVIGYYNSMDTQKEHLRSAKNIVAKHHGRAKMIRCDSCEAANRFDDGSIGFVYIDADHEYNSVLRDIQAWYPKVRRGGIISGHDFIDMPPQFGVRTAVHEFFSNTNYPIYTTFEKLPSWYVIKI